MTNLGRRSDGDGGRGDGGGAIGWLVGQVMRYVMELVMNFRKTCKKILGSTLKPIADAEEHLFGERLRREGKGNE